LTILTGPSSQTSLLASNGYETALFLYTLAAGILFLAALALTPAAFADRGARNHRARRNHPSCPQRGLCPSRRCQARKTNSSFIQTSRDWVQVEAILRAPSTEEGATEDEAEARRSPAGSEPLRGAEHDAGWRQDYLRRGGRLEDQASRRRGRRDAAQDALRLYYRIYDLMPASPLAAEALYRAADIRWQIERSDVMTRPPRANATPTCAGR